MLWYPEDEDGWVLMAEQGSQFYVRNFETIDGEQVLVYVDHYDDMGKYAWYGPGSVEEITSDDDFEIAELTNDNVIVKAEYVESLGYPPAQPTEGHSFNPWRVDNTGRFSEFKDGEQILYKFSKMTGFPYASGIFYEEIEN